MSEATTEPIVYDEAKLKQLEDDDPGITWFGMIKKTLPLVNGVGGKARALFTVLLKALP